MLSKQRQVPLPFREAHRLQDGERLTHDFAERVFFLVRLGLVLLEAGPRAATLRTICSLRTIYFGLLGVEWEELV